MVSVSLCMIVKNEEDVLERCLNSVSDLVDEIVIVDTGSTDRTKEIAARFTRLVFDFPGGTTLPPPETSPSPTPPWTTVCGWTRTMCCWRRTGPPSWS